MLLFESSDVWEPAERAVLGVKEPHVSRSVFRLFVGGEDTCTLDLVQLQTLPSCGFNSSNPLIIITHGWSVRSASLRLTEHRTERDLSKLNMLKGTMMLGKLKTAYMKYKLCLTLLLKNRFFFCCLSENKTFELHLIETLFPCCLFLRWMV